MKLDFAVSTSKFKTAYDVFKSTLDDVRYSK